MVSFDENLIQCKEKVPSLFYFLTSRSGILILFIKKRHLMVFFDRLPLWTFQLEQMAK